MLQRKTFAVIIVCTAVILSTWLLTRTPIKLDTVSQEPASVSVTVSNFRNIEENVNDDWKKILTEVSENSKSVVDITKNANNDFDETTLTAQISKDFMSKYLLLKKGGKELTSDEVMAISNSVISSPIYTNSPAPVYIASNLRVVYKSDKATLRNYRDTVNLILRNRSMQVVEGPISILNEAVSSENQSALTKLENVITIARGLTKDLLEIDVPESAVNVHLGLLNTTSAILSNLESMGQVFSDPVRGYIGISQYNQSMIDFQNALSDINLFFVTKLGSST